MADKGPRHSDHSIADVETAKQTFLRRLLDNLQERFPKTDLGIIEAFSIFDPMMSLPRKHQELVAMENLRSTY